MGWTAGQRLIEQLELTGTLDPRADRQRQRTTDNLFRVRDGKTEAAVHFEIERAWHADIPRRLFEDASAAMTATRLPVWSVVVLLRPGGRPPRGTGVYRIPGGSGDAVVFRYHVVSLWQLDARRMRAELGLQGAPLCVAMRGADETFVQTLADEVRTDQGLTKRERQTTMQLLYVVSAVVLGSDTTRRIFHVESILQDLNVQELIRGWEDQGYAKGLAKGRAEGRVAEARLLLRKVLKARSFAATAAVRARIDRETDVARLESWHEAAVTARVIGDVFRDR